LVSDLICGNPPTWNKTLIDNTFLAIDGGQIQQIPLTHQEINDTIMWAFTDTGDYSVKSGYQVIQGWKTNTDQGPSNQGYMESVWKKVWALETIPRHKVLLWRILNNALPVRDELQKRGIRCSPLCPRCETSLETINHLYVKCEVTRREWFGSQLGINFHNTELSNFNEWLTTFILNNDKDTIISLVALIYSI